MNSFPCKGREKRDGQDKDHATLLYFIKILRFTKTKMSFNYYQDVMSNRLEMYKQWLFGFAVTFDYSSLRKVLNPEQEIIKIPSYLRRS